MKKNQLSILIGGEAGQGLVTIGQCLAKALVRAGYHIVVRQDYMSRVRGGYNTFAIRASVKKITAPARNIDLLVALNQQAVDDHQNELNPKALVVADQGLTCGTTGCFNVPFKELAEKRYLNTLALGVAASLLGLKKELVLDALLQLLGKKSRDIMEKNRQAMDNAYGFTEEATNGFEQLAEPLTGPERLMLNGNEALGLGALAGGIKFLSFYPMTPSTSIALTVIKHADKMKVAYEQAEDEIAAINMAVGASYAGAPTLVTTSGGGFALMVEGLSLAGMAEVPVVIAIAQRPGPATGLPTRTEQADLEFALHAGHGEFPRAILAPGSVKECFDLARSAVKLAEDTQGPVIILTDQYLADSLRAVEPFDLAGFTPLVTGKNQTGFGSDYQRYVITQDGLSPRAIPGLGQWLVVTDSDEHTPDGHITEDLSVRIEINDKRLRKHALLLEKVVPPKFEGDTGPEILLVSWGSSKGICQEAVQELKQRGQRAQACHFSQVWPLDQRHFLDAFKKAGQVVFVEGNATGQFAKLVRRETGFEAHRLVLRYDGLPFDAEYILDSLGKGE
ncbi:2-oxoacid:acceptor oxidoreductase subunit alpha [Dethiosulfatarculus sandiegensis]|uniref:Pyruvate ferredoxin oxidoreductase subunit alpha n=1 Tax=Dethiosulfatarculus sandiegensis TaxID=1429043 RepID=A0A0D2GFH3_9BACT|nr:2-oxoacid:acceptor oxidoreductase subunit alpha [Dethiosulfatarculus sandiegensis]KIX13692.1 pyruvate ferredoxin oxidoreductase subunit alpha [Dethiosulfatarculus sandiegensis]